MKYKPGPAKCGRDPALDRYLAAHRRLTQDVCTLDPPLTPEAAMGRLLTAIYSYHQLAYEPFRFKE